MVGKNVRLENIPCAWVQYKSQGSDIYFVHSFWFLAECSANRGHLSWQQSFRQIGVWEKKIPVKLWNYSSTGPNYFHLSVSLLESAQSRTMMVAVVADNEKRGKVLQEK